MDVSRLLGVLTGEAAPKEGKLLELKPGQVVRGIVLQLLAENEAMLSVNGTPVRAKLEVPIAPGKVSFFQVQPDTGKGQMVLKTLASSTVELPDESVSELLKQHQVKDTPANRGTIRVLHGEGIPLTRSLITSVAQAVAEAAPEVQTEPLFRAAAVAVQRGVPVSADTLRALHTALHGPTPAELLRALERNAREALAAPTMGAPVRQAAERLLGLLQRADALLRVALQPAAAESANEAAPEAHAVRLTASAAAPAPPVAQPPQQAQQQTAAPLISPQRQPAVAQTSAQQQPAASTAPAPSQAAVSAAPADEKPPLLSFMKLLGIDMEREWLRLANKQQPTEMNTREQLSNLEVNKQDVTQAVRQAVGVRQEGERALMQQLSQWIPPAPNEETPGSRTNSSMETLKSVLIQITASDEAPPALKETAQTALQSITGQQLLLTQDRAAPFAHVMMFVPLPGKSGEDNGNAAVHIHTRRGSKGELDADNCRLWFQLSLASLGETWIDVNVVEKHVGLRVMSDHPAAEALLMRNKPVIESALQSLGYQLSNFRHSPKPQETKEIGQSAYVPKTYKGVDYRI